MRYVYGVWYHVYRNSGVKLTLSVRKNVHLALRPVFGDASIRGYKKRCLDTIRAQLQLPYLATVLRDLEPDEWEARWHHAEWSSERIALPFAHTDEKKPLYPLAAQCRRCGHEFIGREAIKAPSLQNCMCFWCHSGKLRLLPRYPSPVPVTSPTQVMMQIL